MSNEKLLNQAIKLLQDVKPNEAESIRTETTTYDDGSSTLEISVDYPIKDRVETERFYD